METSGFIFCYYSWKYFAAFSIISHTIALFLPDLKYSIPKDKHIWWILNFKTEIETGIRFFLITLASCQSSGLHCVLFTFTFTRITSIKYGAGATRNTHTLVHAWSEDKSLLSSMFREIDTDKNQYSQVQQT